MYTSGTAVEQNGPHYFSVLAPLLTGIDETTTSTTFAVRQQLPTYRTITIFVPSIESSDDTYTRTDTIKKRLTLVDDFKLSVSDIFFFFFFIVDKKYFNAFCLLIITI